MRPAVGFASDTHLEEFSYADMPDLYGDTFCAFEQFIDMLLEFELDGVLAGDNFECNRQNYPTSVTIQFVANQLRRLEQKHLKLYYIDGQHDRATRNVSWFAAINDTVTKSIHLSSVVINGIEFIGVNSAFSHQLKPLLDIAASSVSLNYPPVLIAHQRWKEFLKFEGAEDGSLASIPRLFRLVITGDMHKTAWYELKGKGRGGQRVFSPGSTARRSSSEPDEHFVHQLMDDGKTVKSIKIKERPILRVSIKNIHDLDCLADGITNTHAELNTAARNLPSQIAKPLVIVSGSPTIPMFNAVQELFHGVAHVRMSGRAGRETTSVVGLEAGRSLDANSITCKDFVGELALDQKSAELANVAIAAAAKRDKDLIDRWRNDFR